MYFERKTNYFECYHKVWFFSPCVEGQIKVFIEYQKEPLAVVTDKNLLPVKYFSFASWRNSLARFYYDCEGEIPYQEDVIKKQCRYDDAFENEYKEFYKITDIPGIRPEGYVWLLLEILIINVKSISDNR